MEEIGVLVVGGGPTGLTMACELARHGVTPRIIDKAAAPSDKSKAFAVHARTLELFENMGVVDAVLAGGQPARGLAFYDGGRPLVSIDIGRAIASKYPFVQMIAQSDTERILGGHLASYGLHVERQVELVGFSGDGEHVVATLSRPDGTTEHVRCRFIVGNDGAHSTVRKQLGLRFEGAAYPNQWLLADIELHWDLPYDELSVFFHATGTTAFFPLAGRRGRLMFECPDTPIDEPQPEPTLDDVCRLCESRGVPASVVASPRWLAWFRLHHRICEAFRNGPVFLGGDAAHIHSPIGGQGMNMGIQDAYNLAWKLALVERGQALPALLDSYQAERHRTDREIVGFTDRATKAATIHNPVLSAIRNAAIVVVSRFDAVQSRIAGTLAQVELHYRDSPIVKEVWSRPHVPGFVASKDELRAGERVPDYELIDSRTGAATKLYELLKGAEHELLVFCGVAPSEAELAALAQIANDVASRFAGLIELHLIHGPERPDDLPEIASVHLDPGLTMHVGFGAAAASLVLIRPDGYIGFRNQPAKPQALREYLGSIFGG